MSDPNPKLWFARHRDDEWFDEITLKVVPRYKTSGLSGDEWRISVVAQAKRKGVVVAENSWNKMRWAIQCLGGWMAELSDRPLGAEWPNIAGAPEEAFCHQPGCPERAVSVYALRKRFCSEGHESGAFESNSKTREARAFCLRHLRRGDCGLEDADSNYEVVSGPGPDDSFAGPQDESPSAFGGVIYLSEEEVPHE